MLRYTFTALITLTPAHNQAAAARPEPAPCRCVIQPSDDRYFPAVIVRDGHPPARGCDSTVIVPLADAEAARFFARGQRFTIWADVIVGDNIRGDGLIGHGVIRGQATAGAPARAR